MKLYLDGSDWLAGYFLPESEYQATKTVGHIDNMLMDSARSSGFLNRTRRPGGALRASVPGCDRTVLLENGEIDDPYYGRNMERSRWSEAKEWAFRKDFSLPAEWKDCRKLTLTFHSLGYRAQIFLNDEWLGVHEGMFTPWEFEVTDVIDRTGNNVLVLIFDPAPQASSNHERVRPSEFAEFHHCQMSFGWDWARALVPTGIFDHVELKGTMAARLRDCHFRTAQKHVFLEVELGALEAHDTALTVKLAPLGHHGKTVELTRTVALCPGPDNRCKIDFEVDDARFWYPNGYGEQPLYELTLTVPGDEQVRQVGFRDLRMVRNPGSPEGAYDLTFELNGQPIFARGLNWVPADMIVSRLDAALYEREVRLAKEAGFNLFRIWGGGLIEKQAFYDACDRHGMLVWQEFMHACSMYRSDAVYLAAKRHEGEAAVRKLRNHVSTALFCGGNEVQYYGESPDNPLYRQYAELVAALAPGVPYHLSSPDLSRPGERHHGPWCFLEHSFWNDHFRQLASELGCNGFAEAESIDRFIPPGDPCPAGQHWKYHFTFDHGQRPITPMLENFRPDPEDRRQLSQASMFTQADLLGYVMEHYRRNYPAASGCFIWQYNESWPTNSFGIIDFYTMPKMAYYRLARANRNAVLFLEDASWRIADGKLHGTLFLCNDSALPRDARIAATGIDLHGRVLFAETFAGDRPAGVAELGKIAVTLPDELPGGVLLVLLRITAGDRTLFANERIYGVPDFSRALHLEPAELACRWRSVPLSGDETLISATVENTGKIAALNLRLSADEVDFRQIYWQDNYFCLAPGECRTITARLTAGAPRPATLTLYGWNHPETRHPTQEAQS